VITNDPSPLSDHSAPEPEVFPDTTFPTTTAPLPETTKGWWEVGKAVFAWVGSVLLLILVPLLIIFPYFIYLALNKVAISAESLGQDKTFILLSIAGVIPAHALTLLMAWILVTNWGRVPFWQTLGFSWPRSMSPWRGVGGSFLIAIFLLGFGALITNLLGGEKTDLDKLIESSFQARLATVFLAVVTAPLVEEVIYRGILYPAIQRVVGLGWAIAIVSLLFAGVHVFQYRNNVGVIIVITILSVTLTAVRAFTNRLLPSFMVHLIFNGLQSVYLILQPFIEKPEKIQPAPALVLIWRVTRHLF
jgi:CAAX protease family protein